MRSHERKIQNLREFQSISAWRLSARVKTANLYILRVNTKLSLNAILYDSGSQRRMNQNEKIIIFFKKTIDKNRKMMYSNDRRCDTDSAIKMVNGSIAQLGEHLPYKQRVTGSSPVVPTIMARQFSWLERQPVTLEVDGSSPFRVAIFRLCSSVGRAAD